VNRRMRRLTAAAMGVAGSATVVALLVTPAQAQAPDVTAWWNAANVGNGAPAPPPPPDVAAGDLLVQGSNANGSAPTTPVSGAPVTSQAVAGLIFDLPDGATVGSLTLHIDGTAPPSAPTIVACKATQMFGAADNGAWTDVPPSDCTQTSAAKLSSDGSSLVFDDVGKLASDGRLAITLLPGAVDRVVLKKPDDGALEVTSSGGSLGGSVPAFGSGSGNGFSSQPQAAPPPVAAVGGSAVLPPASTDSGAVAPPVVAPSPTAASGGGFAPAASRAAAGTGGLSTTQRRVLALFVIGLELLGFLMLLGERDAERSGIGPVAPALAGGRLRPPDRGHPARTAAATIGGVGRFRGERQGRPPRL
jgi:hypothetical protein